MILRIKRIDIEKHRRAFLNVIKFLILIAFTPLGAIAQINAEGYPVETVRWDMVPHENYEVIEQLFADIFLVPEGGDVKKFYISNHEVKEGLWSALMVNTESPTDSIQTDSLKKDNIISSSDIMQFVARLRKQTGKRFRLPTDAERLWAAESQQIDTIADAADLNGKGFHLALDTIARAEQKMVVITATDGTQTKYLLEGMPRVTIEKPYLVITAIDASVSLPLEQLQHIHYEKATDEATAIEEIKIVDEKGSRNHIDFSNLPVDTNISVYTLDGKKVYNMRVIQGKTISLPMSSLQSGIYLVKVNDVTYKIMKP